MAVLLSSCSVHGLAFVQDTRLKITSPPEFALVPQPVTVRWAVRDFIITGHDGQTVPTAGYFGVFLDIDPPPVGKTLAYLARGDKTCKASEGCPNATYFANLHIYTTSATHFTLPPIPLPPSGTHGNPTHTVTVALFNGAGQRLGESAFAMVDFRVPNTPEEG